MQIAGIMVSMHLKKVFSCGLFLTISYRVSIAIKYMLYVFMLLVLFTLKLLNSTVLFPFLYNKHQATYACLPIALVLHSVVDFIDLLCKDVKLRDDEFLSEGLDQQDHISTDTPGGKTAQFRDSP